MEFSDSDASSAFEDPPPGFSDADGDVSDLEDIPSMRGVLCKWTNYVYGWQERFVCCHEGTLSYYLSRDDTAHGCRGSISLVKSECEPSQFDPCRFDVKIDDSSVWYLRASSKAERARWIDAIAANRLDLDVVSVRSATGYRSAHGLKEKLAELASFRDILDRQVRVLQKCYESCADSNGHRRNNGNWQHGAGGKVGKAGGDDNAINGVDLKGEALIFKETTRGLLSTLALCMEMLNLREEDSKSATGKRSYSTAFQGSLQDVTTRPQTAEVATQTDAEGSMSQESDSHSDDDDDSEKIELAPKLGRHRFSAKLEEQVRGHLENALQPADPGDSGGGWELIAEDGELLVYRMDMVKDGVICDPLKATHSVSGVTAREMCHFFWDPEVRMDWEETVERFRVVEVLDEATAVMHQVHKRVWPTAQRDCLYLASMFAMPNPEHLSEAPPRDTWMACNFSVDHDDAQLADGCLRAEAEICLYCHTYVATPADGRAPDRDCLRCEVVYVANVNPGGWAPAAALRAIYKREYPKFLRRLSAYAQDKTRDREIWF